MNTENTARTINVIPAIAKLVQNELVMKPRVCAYARVSTDNEDQLNSYKNQCDYYDKTLGADPNIIYMGLYKDPGITGTKMRKRKEFLQMIEDCKAGKITRIITKSVQRFARNAVECLSIARELFDKGVTIKFETSGIDTKDPNSWLALSILATIAEEESRTISHNITWTYQKKFEKGEYAGPGKIYGYKIENGEFKIIPNEALIIQRIFDLYLQGNTLRGIKKELEDSNILSPFGNQNWRAMTIKAILSNEKYKGDLLLQKSFKQDVLCERKQNLGEKPQYLVKNNHSAIVSREKFDLVQTEMILRETKKIEDSESGLYYNEYAFSSLIECGECGAKFRRHSQLNYDRTKKIPIWVCTRHQNHHDQCSMKPIREENLERGFVEALQLIISRREDILDKIRNNIYTTINKPDMANVQSLKEQLELKQKQLIDENLIKNGNTVPIIKEIKDIQDKLEIYKKNIDDISIIEFRMQEIDKILNNSYTEFNKEICKALIEKVVIKDKHTATYIFKCGIAIEQII